MSDRAWEELSLDEKLAELGIEGGTADERLHAALDLLADSGNMLNDIETVVAPDGIWGGDIIGFDFRLACERIYDLVSNDTP